MFVDVHLDQLDLAPGGADCLFDDWGELLAGAAPRSPEIDQHRLALRFLNDILHERLGRGVLDEVGRRHCRGPAALLHYRHVIPRLPNVKEAASSMAWAFSGSFDPPQEKWPICKKARFPRDLGWPSGRKWRKATDGGLLGIFNRAKGDKGS